MANSLSRPAKQLLQLARGPVPEKDRHPVCSMHPGGPGSFPGQRGAYLVLSAAQPQVCQTQESSRWPDRVGTTVTVIGTVPIVRLSRFCPI